MATILATVLSLVMLLSLCDVGQAGLTHRTDPNYSFADLTEAEEECLKDGKFYSSKTKKCHELLSTGPCADDERFVLRKHQRNEDKLVLKAICVKSVCGDKKYWAQTDSCVSAADRVKLCGTSPKVILTENIFGEGECACAKVPPHARLNDDPNEECHELYQRGPCGYRQVLAVPPGSVKPQCVEDVCYDSTLALREQEGGERRTTVWFHDGCYELEKSGKPCLNNGTLKISAISWSVLPQAQCVVLSNFIPTGSSCNGPCGSNAKVKSYDFYKNNLAYQLRNSFAGSGKRKDSQFHIG